MKAALRPLLLLHLLVLSAYVGSGCRKETPAKDSKDEQPSPQVEPAKPVELPTRVDIGVPIEDPNRWLFVQKVEGKAKGGWATGSFDASRNKLTITTSDIEEFALDTGKVKINWQKLVVLSIDGKNSELRKRDYDILHFVRTPHGEWVVKEP